MVVDGHRTYSNLHTHAGYTNAGSTKPMIETYNVTNVLNRKIKPRKRKRIPS